MTGLCRFSLLGALVGGLALSTVAGARGYFQELGARITRPLNIQLGVRPYFLIGEMDEGPLKEELQACTEGPFRKSSFSIGHRGAPLQFPEHTRESYEAAARMGAGVLECDVTFTKDRELVCRHAQCDLHTTTNILAIPELAAKCTRPFSPATDTQDADALCCTSDITLQEFKSLCGKMDGSNPRARTVTEYMAGTPGFRTDLYSSCGTVVSHAESIELFSNLGTKFTPELKSPEVAMPFEGEYTQQAYAQQLIDEYKRAGVAPRNVYPQSFQVADVEYWIAEEPRFGRQAVFLESTDVPADLDPATARLSSLREKGVRIVAPPMWALLTTDTQGRIVPSDYARAIRRQGFDIITWTLERSGPLTSGGGYYFQSVQSAIDGDGDTFTVLDVLARQVGVIGVFSDWPATVTYYANCTGLR